MEGAVPMNSFLSDWKSMTGSKPEFPEATETLESLSTSLDDMRKAAKFLFPFLIEVCQAFDQYGKISVRASKAFSSLLQKLAPEDTASLAEGLKSVSQCQEDIGNVVSAQFMGLMTVVTKADFVEEATNLRKAIGDEVQTVAKELSASKSSQEKAFAKYEKQIKEMELTETARDKAKADPGNTYQVSLLQKHEDKTKSSRAQTQQAILSVNEQREKVNSRATALEKAIQSGQERFFLFDRKALQSAFACYTAFLSAMQTIVASTQSLPDQATLHLEKVANIAMDMARIQPGTARRGDAYTSESLSKHLELRLSSFEERRKAVKGLKVFMTEMAAAEDSLAKGLKGLTGTVAGGIQYFSQKPASNQAWRLTVALFDVCAALHANRAKELTGEGMSQLTNIVTEQTAMSKKLEETLQKTIKDHAQLEDEAFKELEKAQMTEGDDMVERKRSIAERILKSASDAEDQVLCLLHNQEAGQLDILKRILSKFLELENELKTEYHALVSHSEPQFSGINVQADSVESRKFKMMGEFPMELIPNIEIPAEEEEVKEDEAPSVLTKFGLPSDQPILSKYSCALQDKILLQGKMYLTSSHICFISMFNSSTLLGGETRVVIPVKDIVRVEKRKIMLVIDNSMLIVTKATNHFFASLMRRDQVIAAIEALMQNAIEEKPPESITPIQSISEPIKDLSPPLQGDVVLSPKEENGLTSVIETGKPDTEKSGFDRASLADKMFPEAQLTLRPFKTEVAFEGSAKEVFTLFFASADFWRKYLTPLGNTDIEITDWSPPPPEFYSPAQKGKWVESSGKTMSYTHPVREKVPFMPSTCPCKEDWTVFWVSKKEFIMEAQVLVSKVPLSDCFIVKMRWNVLETDKTRIDVQYGVHFIKDTWFKGKIERSSVSESSEALNDGWIPLALSTWKDYHTAKTQAIKAILVKQEDEKSILAEKMIPEAQLTHHLFKTEVAFEGSAKEVFSAFFASADFWRKYLTPRGDIDIEITDWSPSPPEFYSPAQKGKWVESSTRTLAYTHPVREKIPFMPTTCGCKEDWTVFWISKKEFIVEAQVKVSGVPMSDCFIVKMRWNVLETDKTRIDVQYGVHFIKDTWFKGKIQTSSVSEATEALNDVWVPLATEAWKEFTTPATVVSVPESIPEGKEVSKKEPVSSVRPGATPVYNRDPLTWVLLAIVLVLMLQVYRLSSRFSILEANFNRQLG